MLKMFMKPACRSILPFFLKELRRKLPPPQPPIPIHSHASHPCVPLPQSKQEASIGLVSDVEGGGVVDPSRR